MVIHISIMVANVLIFLLIANAPISFYIDVKNPSMDVSNYTIPEPLRLLASVYRYEN